MSLFREMDTLLADCVYRCNFIETRHCQEPVAQHPREVEFRLELRNTCRGHIDAADTGRRVDVRRCGIVERPVCSK